MSIRPLFIAVFGAALFATGILPVRASEAPSPVLQSTTTVASVVSQSAPKTTPLVQLPAQEPLDAFWDELAQCETGGNWKDRGNWAGGLGIAKSTWTAFGGSDFARSPDRATREEQIEVANRIAVHGYQTKNRFRTLADKPHNPMFQHAVGFGGWGALSCAGGRPHLMKYSASTVVLQKFKWGQRGRLVKDLQAIVGVRTTAVYDQRTWAKHYEFLVRKKMDLSLSPKPKLKKTLTVPVGQEKKCQGLETIALEAGFPESEIETLKHVAWRESRCVAGAINSSDPKGGSFGLMQINNIWVRRLVRDGVISNRNQLLDINKNIEAAFYVWIRSIASGYHGWRPWGL